MYKRRCRMFLFILYQTLATINIHIYLFCSFWFRAKDSMTEPGLNIYREILLRLQVKDLFWCKSVCKSWNSLISTRCFTKSHLNYIVEKKVDNNETGDTRITALTSTSLCVDDCKIVRRRECKVVVLRSYKWYQSAKG